MPDDESSDLFPELVAAVPPPLMAPTEPVISIQAAASDRHSASKPARSAPLPSSGQLISEPISAIPCSPSTTMGNPSNFWSTTASKSSRSSPTIPRRGSYKLLLRAISKVSGNTQDILAQWLEALWLGAAHLEQTKFLHWEDLDLILGSGVRYPTQQREKLQALAADPELIQALFGQSALVGRRRGHGPLIRSPRQARHRRADCVGGLVQHR